MIKKDIWRDCLAYDVMRTSLNARGGLRYRKITLRLMRRYKRLMGLVF